MIKTLITATLEKSINIYLRLDAHALDNIAVFAGKVVKIEFSQSPNAFYLLLNKEGVELLNSYEHPPNTTIKASLLDLIATHFSNDTTAALKNIAISGDVELGQQLYHILRNIDIDWENYLSYCVGDIAAHQISNSLRDLRHWASSAFANFSQNMTEYLQEEIKQLPSAKEVELFFTDIRELQNDSERLSARLALIEKCRQSPP